MNYILGQIFGIIATAASIIMPFFKQKWQMLATTALVNLLMLLNLILIGEIGSAVGLCAVAVVQCLVSLYHTLKEAPAARWETFLFPVLYLGFGFFGLFTAPGFVWGINAHNLLELLPILGSLLSMTFVFIREEQKARYVLLATCLVWSVYLGIVGSTTFFAQFASLVITLAAIFKYRKKA